MSANELKNDLLKLANLANELPDESIKDRVQSIVYHHVHSFINLREAYKNLRFFHPDKLDRIFNETELNLIKNSLKLKNDCLFKCVKDFTDDNSDLILPRTEYSQVFKAEIPSTSQSCRDEGSSSSHSNSSSAQSSHSRQYQDEFYYRAQREAQHRREQYQRAQAERERAEAEKRERAREEERQRQIRTKELIVALEQKDTKNLEYLLPFFDVRELPFELVKNDLTELLINFCEIYNIDINYPYDSQNIIIYALFLGKFETVNLLLQTLGDPIEIYRQLVSYKDKVMMKNYLEIVRNFSPKHPLFVIV